MGLALFLLLYFCIHIAFMIFLYVILHFMYSYYLLFMYVTGTFLAKVASWYNNC